MRRLLASAVILGLALSGATGALADAMTGATSRAGFNDTASWPVHCAQGLASVSSTSGSGVGVTATDASGGIDQEIQMPPGCSYGGWLGNFAPGDGLLYTGKGFGDGAGPMTLTFSEGVGGAGVQIMTAVYGSFTASVSAYDGTTLLGTFSENGTGNSDEDNSAIFIGIEDLTGANITSIVLDTPTDEGDFAINEVSLMSSASAAVPEPSSLPLLLAGLSLLGGAMYFGRKKIGASKA